MVVPIHLAAPDDIQYDIRIDPLPDLHFDRKVAVVTNPTVWGLHGDYLMAHLDGAEI